MNSIKFMTSIIFFWLKGKIEWDSNFLKLKVPNTLFGILPLGAFKKSIPINQISSVVTDFSLAIKNIIVGVILAFLGLIFVDSSVLIMLILMIAGVVKIIDAFQTVMGVTLTSGEVVGVPFIIFEKKKAEEVSDALNRLISARMDDTNTRLQTDRIVDAINKKQ